MLLHCNAMVCAGTARLLWEIVQKGMLDTTLTHPRGSPFITRKQHGKRVRALMGCVSDEQIFSIHKIKPESATAKSAPPKLKKANKEKDPNAVSFKDIRQRINNFYKTGGQYNTGYTMCLHIYLKLSQRIISFRQL